MKAKFYSPGKGSTTRRGKAVVIAKTLGARKSKVVKVLERSNKFYHTNSWRITRQSYIKEKPLCEISYMQGKLIPAVQIHHIKPLEDGGEQLDKKNLMSLGSELLHREIHSYIEQLRSEGNLPWENGMDMDQTRDFFLEWAKNR